MLIVIGALIKLPKTTGLALMAFASLAFFKTPIHML